MSTSPSLDALRRAGPKAPLDADIDAVRARIDTTRLPVRPRRRRRRLVPAVAAAALVAGGAALALSTTGSRGTGDAVAAVRKAARVTAASAERSGTAVVRMTYGGQPWAGKTVRWNGDDVAVSEDVERRRELRVVDGTLYEPNPEGGGWLDLGSPSHIDPGSGTTPSEYLASVREDVGGTTLQRILGGMTRLSVDAGADGATVYRGHVPAGLIAREQGFKEGHTIRVLPFGYVAHDQAADPNASVQAAVTVADGVVRELTVTWGTWTYSVAYHGLGSTAAPAAPRNAQSLEQLRRARAERALRGATSEP
jgi:hypothetical protein